MNLKLLSLLQNIKLSHPLPLWKIGEKSKRGKEILLIHGEASSKVYQFSPKFLLTSTAMFFMSILLIKKQVISLNISYYIITKRLT